MTIRYVLLCFFCISPRAFIRQSHSFSFQMDLKMMEELVNLINFTDPSFCVAVIAIIFNPLFWNVVRAAGDYICYNPFRDRITANKFNKWILNSQKQCCWLDFGRWKVLYCLSVSPFLINFDECFSPDFCELVESVFSVLLRVFFSGSKQTIAEYLLLFTTVTLVIKNWNICSSFPCEEEETESTQYMYGIWIKCKSINQI